MPPGSRPLLAALLVVGLCGGTLSAAQPEQLQEVPLDLVTLPPGFSISLYSTAKVSGARNLALGYAAGNTTIVYVSSNNPGRVRVRLPCGGWPAVAAAAQRSSSAGRQSRGPYARHSPTNQCGPTPPGTPPTHPFCLCSDTDHGSGG